MHHRQAIPFIREAAFANKNQVSVSHHIVKHRSERIFNLLGVSAFHTLYFYIQVILCVKTIGAFA